MIASYVFYLLTDFLLIVFIIVTTLSVYGTARFFERINKKQKLLFGEKDEEWLEKNRKRYKRKAARQKKIWITLALVLNIGLLAFYKYFGAASVIVNDALSQARFCLEIGRVNLLIPLGISFYTFQAIGYLVDVYYGKVQAERNVFKFALFVSFFPQLVQGPISRFSQLAPQLIEGHSFDFRRIKNGVLLALFGVFKVFCIATPSLVLFNNITGNLGVFGGAEIFLAVLMYTAWLYASFSGGIDIAQGVSQILGIDLESNFKRPFFSTSVGEFWRRWHITLGAWMREYVFYPITLSKRFNKVNKKFRTAFKNNFGRIFPTCAAMFFVFFLVGIWHGAELKWIVYGLYHGFFISLGIYMKEPLQKWGAKHPRLTKKNKLIKLLAIIATVSLVMFGFMMIAAPNLSVFGDWIACMFTTGASGDFLAQVNLSVPQILALGLSIMLLFGISLIQEKGIKIREALDKKSQVFRVAVYVGFLFTILLLGWLNVGGGFAYGIF